MPPGCTSHSAELPGGSGEPLTPAKSFPAAMETPRCDGFSISWTHPGQGSLPRRRRGNRRSDLRSAQAKLEGCGEGRAGRIQRLSQSQDPLSSPPLPTHLDGCFWEEREWEFRVSSLGQDLAPFACGQCGSQHDPTASRLLFTSRAVSPSRLQTQHLSPKHPKRGARPGGCSRRRLRLSARRCSQRWAPARLRIPNRPLSPGAARPGSEGLVMSNGDIQHHWWGGRGGAGAEARHATDS